MGLWFGGFVFLWGVVGRFLCGFAVGLLVSGLGFDFW